MSKGKITPEKLARMIHECWRADKKEHGDKRPTTWAKLDGWYKERYVRVAAMLLEKLGLLNGKPVPTEGGKDARQR